MKFTSLCNDGIESAVLDAIKGGTFIHGPQHDIFESRWAGYCGSAYCVGLDSGCDALEFALRAVCGPGGTAIVPGWTHPATWMAATLAGLNLIPVDPTPGEYGISPRVIGQILRYQKVDVIVATHMYGIPCDMEAIGTCINHSEQNVVVISDSCQAHGAIAEDDCSLVDAWSFYPTKNLGAIGDCGAITTNSGEIAEIVRMSRNYGAETADERSKGKHKLIGRNSRLDEVQAAVLNKKLGNLDTWNARRTEIADRYMDELDDLDDLAMPRVPESVTPSWHQFVIRSRHRDALRYHLETNGVPTAVHYPVAPAYTPVYRNHTLRTFTSLWYSRTVISLPIHPKLTDDEQTQVIKAIRSF